MKNKTYNDSLKIVAKGGIITLTGLFIGKIIGYLYIIFIARLGTYEYGLLSLAFAIVSFITVFSIVGLDNGLLRYVSYYSARKDERRVKGVVLSSIKISLSLSLLFFIVLFIFSKQISVYIFHNPDLTPMLRIFSLMIPFLTLTNAFLAILKAFKKIEYDVFVREIAEKSIRLVVFLILFFIGFGVLGATISYLTSAIGIFLISLYYLNKTFPLKNKIKPIYYNKELIYYSIPLLLSGTLLVVIAWADILMIGYFRTAAEVGIYNAALPTAGLMFVLPAAIISLFLPVVMELYSKNKINEIKALYKRVSKWIFLTSLPIMLIMFVFSRKIIEIIFGLQYVEGEIALSILVVGYLFYAISYTSSNILAMLKKTKITFIISLVSALSNVILNYFFIPPWGINGAAIATSLSFLIGGLFYGLYSYKEMRLQPTSKNFITILILGILSIFIIYNIRKLLPVSLNLFYTFLLFFSFLLLYILLILLFKIIDKEDINLLSSFKKRITNILNIRILSFD